MWQYIVRRICIGVVVLMGVSMIIYGLIRTAPGDYVSTLTSSNPEVTQEMVDRLNELYGLNDSIPEGYAKWAAGVFRGDLGDSFIEQKPVAEVLSSKMWISFWMAFPAYILQILIAIPLGILSATKQYSKIDYAVTTIALMGMSLPSFFFAAILQRIFAQGLGWFPLSGMKTARMDYEGFALMLDMAKHLVLPVMVLTVLGIGGLMRYCRTNMLEVLNEDYIRTARAKGLSESKVVYKHAFRNTLIPIVTILGGMIPGLFSGSMITEGIFGIDGIGNTALTALRGGDIPYIMGSTLFMAALTLVGTLVSDVLYGVVDPRVRLK
ncbi:MAG: diguanylate cyclase [Epulopiscium sp. Nele67-Bin002]|nr:MAG: diguanylate cyclase [Epulopiscium sp. Nuni2H_MBin001]OON90587.1 MAG: diguanylate cyclase [Epulopiscium sp. Nele67-Bin002]